jgi:ribonuclease J
MKEGDSFLFSSKTIPGNERDVIRIWNAYSKWAWTVVPMTRGKYHVSGHANRPDLEGGASADPARHADSRCMANTGICANMSETAPKPGIASAVATNGTMLDLTGDVPVVAEYVETGRLYLDGSVLIGRDGRGGARPHPHGAERPCAMVTVILDEADKPLGEPGSN